MARPRKSKQKSANLAVNSGAPKGVLYARVSTPEQEKEGYSIDAQVKLIRDYASSRGLAIVSEYIDVETAKRSGRSQFEEMLRYLKSHPSVRHILVEKTDRLYRNLKDWVTLDEFDIEIHLVKEGSILSNDSRSSEKFMHGIKVLMAKNYIDNLSEETRKGMLEKAQQGIWPSHAPIGYDNVAGPTGKRIIVPDPINGPMVTRLFEWFETGHYSLKDVTRKANEEGFRYRKSGRPVGVSTVHNILRNRIYTGSFIWAGRMYEGTYEPLVTVELWQNVQDVLDGRSASNVRAEPLRFPFTGLISCGHCGCAVVAQMQKGKYVYYHCSGFRQKCPEKYVREEVIAEQFAQQLKRLYIDDQIFGLIERAIRESFMDESRERVEMITRVREEADRLQKRLDTLYVDHLDGRITGDMHDRMAATWREERQRCQRQIEAMGTAEDALIDDGIALLNLARQAHAVFANAPGDAQRTALNLLVLNASWANGTLSVEFREPFGMLEEIGPPEGSGPSEERAGSSPRPVWLPG